MLKFFSFIFSIIIEKNIELKNILYEVDENIKLAILKNLSFVGYITKILHTTLTNEIDREYVLNILL